MLYGSGQNIGKFPPRRPVGSSVLSEVRLEFYVLLVAPAAFVLVLSEALTVRLVLQFAG